MRISIIERELLVAPVELSTLMKASGPKAVRLNRASKRPSSKGVPGISTRISPVSLSDVSVITAPRTT